MGLAAALVVALLCFLTARGCRRRSASLNAAYSPHAHTRTPKRTPPKTPPKVPGNVRARLIDVFGGIYRSDAGAVVDALTELGVIKPTGDALSLRRAISYFIANLQRATSRDETVRAFLGRPFVCLCVCVRVRVPVGVCVGPPSLQGARSPS